MVERSLCKNLYLGTGFDSASARIFSDAILIAKISDFESSKHAADHATYLTNAVVKSHII